MNKQKENERDLRRLRKVGGIIFIILSFVLMYGGIKLIDSQVNQIKTINQSLMFILSIFGVYGLFLFTFYIASLILPKNEEEKAIDEAKKKIEIEFLIKRKEKRLKELKNLK